MAYAIMRVAKIRSGNAINRFDFHNQHREKLQLAHPEYTQFNQTLRHGKHDKMRLIDAYHNEVKDIKMRKNACPCCELVLTFSPEVKGLIETGDFNINEWVKANINWLSKQFGGKENILQYELHLDEATPHLHALVLCKYQDKNGKEKVGYNHYLDGPQSLRELQDNYAKAMEVFGLERGERGSKKRHKSVKQWKQEQEELKALWPIFTPEVER